MTKKTITVGLAGNPNSGKTTIFNTITGERQHVGNYPGVTVEKKTGIKDHGDYRINFIDLPGIYSLTAYSVEEIVTRDFIINEHPDLIVNIIDSSNIERNLYLTTQLIEMNIPLVMVFNMSDIAKQRGIEFDNEKLSRFFNAPIVATVADKDVGTEELLKTIVDTFENTRQADGHIIEYGTEIEDELKKIEAVLIKENRLIAKYGSRWLALKVLEQDSKIHCEVHSPEITETIQKSIDFVTRHFGDNPEIVIADKRYGFISGACEEAVKNTVEHRHSVSDITDKVVLNRILGLPIFAITMFIVFKISFWVAGPFVRLIEKAFEYSAAIINGLWPAGSESMIQSLIVDGIIAGVGGVVVFLPNILLLFAAIAVLEDSGYMARAAFIMDRLMHKIGLHGKSFIPMLIGFGCSVPAIMATRILENKRNRFTTIMVIPLISCGARLTIYSLLIPAFFAPKWQGPVLWCIYFTGIILAVICAKLLRITVLKGETTPFVMELPPYRVPTFSAICMHTWHRGWLYLKKAGTVILLISILLWAGTTYPKPAKQTLNGKTTGQIRQAELEYSIVGRTGKAIEPLIKPLGFDWKIGTALIGATAAKEVFISQLGIIYSVGNDQNAGSLRQRLRQAYSPLTAFCIMLFCLISTPCIATLAVTRQETNSWKWALLQFAGLTALAYIITLAVYQIGKLII